VSAGFDARASLSGRFRALCAPASTLPNVADVTILHNTACSTSKHALAEVEETGTGAEIVQYLKTPLDRAALLELIGKLEDPPADLVRKDPYFAQLGLDADDYVTPAAVADLLVEHPRLMQRPVLIKDTRAIIGRPKERVRPFLDS
jgi:arsenate reductase (glutaredoxin)